MPRTPRGDNPSLPARPPRRTRYPDLSPTRAPTIAADLALWPAWTDRPIDRLGLILLDEDGRRVTQAGGH